MAESRNLLYKWTPLFFIIKFFEIGKDLIIIYAFTSKAKKRSDVFNQKEWINPIAENCL
jgi:hypothetical protein